MSLRAFHIFFILTALSCLAFLAHWSGSRVLAGEGGQNTVLAAGSVLGLLIGVPYLVWFIRKTRTPGL